MSKKEKNLRKKSMVFRLLQIPGRHLCRWAFPSRIQGLENFPEKGKIIVCSNHISNFDPLYLSTPPKRQLRYMAKKELFKNKFAGWFISQMGAFPVDRGSGDTESINLAAKVLEDRGALAIFIEGTRSKDGQLGRPRNGAAMLAFQNKAPVIPVCITTKSGKAPKLFERVVISYGEVIPYEELGFVEGSSSEIRDASRLIMSKIAEMREHDQPIVDAF